MIESHEYQGDQSTYLIAESGFIAVEAAGIRWTKVEAFPEHKIRARFELLDALATRHLSCERIRRGRRVPSSLHRDELFGGSERGCRLLGAAGNWRKFRFDERSERSEEERDLEKRGGEKKDPVFQERSKTS